MSLRFHCQTENNDAEGVIEILEGYYPATGYLLAETLYPGSERRVGHKRQGDAADIAERLVGEVFIGVLGVGIELWLQLPPQPLVDVVANRGRVEMDEGFAEDHGQKTQAAQACTVDEVSECVSGCAHVCLRWGFINGYVICGEAGAKGVVALQLHRDILVHNRLGGPLLIENQSIIITSAYKIPKGQACIFLLLGCACLLVAALLMALD